jgi:hypothetical protein
MSGRQAADIFNQRPAMKLFCRITFLNLVEAARFGYFLVGLLIASQESIAIDLCGPTPDGSLMVFAPLRHQLAHVQSVAVSGRQ